MIIFGSPNAVLPVITNTFIVYNLSSNLVNANIPKLNFQYIQNLDFSDKNIDQLFTDIIFNNDAYFVEFMRIIIALRDGYDVALLVYREEDLFDPFTETIGKLIQQRYGYNYQLLNEPDDFDEFDGSSFDINGTFMLDQDCKRYTDIMIQLDPKSFINERIDDSHI